MVLLVSNEKEAKTKHIFDSYFTLGLVIPLRSIRDPYSMVTWNLFLKKFDWNAWDGLMCTRLLEDYTKSLLFKNKVKIHYLKWDPLSLNIGHRVPTKRKFFDTGQEILCNIMKMFQDKTFNISNISLGLPFFNLLKR